VALGLEKMLARISEDPNNGIFIDRYLALVTDMVDSEFKATAVLELAAIIVECDPLLSLRLSYLVFNYDHKNLPALDQMAKALEALGRPGKAEAIRNERDKLAIVEQEFAQDSLAKPPTGSFPDNLSRAELLGTSSELNVEFYDPNANISPSASSIDALGNAPFEIEQNDDVPEEPQLLAPPSEASAIYAPVPEEEEEHDDEPVAIQQLFAENEREHTVSRPAPFVAPPPPPPPREEEAPLARPPSRAEAPAPPEQQEKKQAWAQKIDALIAARNARRALHLIRMKIAKENDHEWAELAWQRLPQIWRQLGLKGSRWHPQDGIAQLRAILEERPLPNWSSLYSA